MTKFFLKTHWNEKIWPLNILKSLCKSMFDHWRKATKADTNTWYILLIHMMLEILSLMAKKHKGAAPWQGSRSVPSSIGRWNPLFEKTNQNWIYLTETWLKIDSNRLDGKLNWLEKTDSTDQTQTTHDWLKTRIYKAFGKR